MAQPFSAIHLSLFISLIFSGSFIPKPPGEPAIFEATCAYPFGRPSDKARCIGASPCMACTTCEYCAHCSNGGSCGVCGGGSRSKSYNSNSAPTRSYYSNPSATNTAPQKPTARTIYLPANATVSAPVLNVRSGPSVEYKLLARLVEGDLVLVTDTAGDKWVKIEVTIFGDNGVSTIEGYVYKNYLSF